MEKSFLQSILQSVASLSGMPLARQGLFVLVLAATLSLALALVLWSTNEDYVPLYPGLSVQDTAEISAVLETQGMDYRIEPGSGLLTVRSSSVQQAKLMLANQGLPRTSDNSGYAMLYEENTIGTSQFIEQARFTRALEQELTTTIELINGVREARVHLSVPKQTSFVRAAARPSASVMVNLANGSQLSDNQISGITHLVASSVSGLVAEDVSVVDQRGALLSRGTPNEFTVSADHFQLTRNLERDYAARVVDILTPIVGEGNVRTQVTAELDFTQAEITDESYDPASSVVRSEQTSNESQSSQPATTPGALAAAPPPIPLDNAQQQAQQAAIAVDSQQNRVSTTRNFEIDKTISYRKSAPGAINRLSVAVVVDLGAAVVAPVAAEGEEAAPVAPDNSTVDTQKLERLRQLVQDAVGFNAERGDTVFITNESFSTALEEALSEAGPIWMEPWFQSLLKQVAVFALAAFIAGSVLRPAMRAVVLQREAQGAAGKLALQGGGQAGGAQASLPGGAAARAEDGRALVVGLNQFAGSGGGTALAAAAPVSEYDHNVSVLQRLVEKEPMRVSKMIGEWAAKD